jgi:hypothetical protein
MTFKRVVYVCAIVMMLAGCVAMDGIAASDAMLDPITMSSLGIDSSAIKSKDTALCAIGRLGANSAMFQQCYVILTSNEIELIAWNRRREHSFRKLLSLPLESIDSVALVHYGSGASLRQVHLHSEDRLVVLSYSKNETDIAEKIYGQFVDAGIPALCKTGFVYAETNPDGIAPMIFPLK